MSIWPGNGGSAGQADDRAGQVMPALAGGSFGRRYWRAAGWGTAAITLLAPFVAMQFSDEVAWTAFDVAIFAAILLAVGGTIELTVRVTDDRAFRAAVARVLVAAIAPVSGVGRGSPRWPWDTLVSTGFWVALWSLSVALFCASRENEARIGVRA